MEEKFKYYALITHQTGGDDEKWAKWLKRRIENYRIPVEVAIKLNGDEGAEAQGTNAGRTNVRVVSERLSVVRAPAEDTPFSDMARYLIVVCSPRGAKSDKVSEHVKLFVDGGRGSCVIPFIIDGSPVGEEDSICYPPALSAAVLGVTLSDGTKEQALIRIVARLLSVKYSQLYQRHLMEQRRFVVRALGAAAMLLVVTIALAAWAVGSEISSSRRREESDSLVKFLIEELDDKTGAGLHTGLRTMIDERVNEYYERRGVR